MTFLLNQKRFERDIWDGVRVTLHIEFLVLFSLNDEQSPNNSTRNLPPCSSSTGRKKLICYQSFCCQKLTLLTAKFFEWSTAQFLQNNIPKHFLPEHFWHTPVLTSRKNTTLLHHFSKKKTKVCFDRLRSLQTKSFECKYLIAKLLEMEN